MRKIITYSTLGDNMKEVYSSATLWGDLQRDLENAGVRFEGLRAMTNPGQVTLESLQAELPEGEFQLFLMPQKVKSGYVEDEEDDFSEEDEQVTHDDIDWEDNDPECFDFKTPKDQAISFLKRANILTTKAISILSNKPSGSTEKPTSDPILASLREQAAELQRNMNMFN